jgi:hypothetical protein
MPNNGLVALPGSMSAAPMNNIWCKSVFDTPRGLSGVTSNRPPALQFASNLSVDTEAAPQLPTPTITSRPESTLYRDSLHFDFSETIKGMSGSPVGSETSAGDQFEGFGKLAGGR